MAQSAGVCGTDCSRLLHAAEDVVVLLFKTQAETPSVFSDQYVFSALPWLSLSLPLSDMTEDMAVVFWKISRPDTEFNIHLGDWT